MTYLVGVVQPDVGTLAAAFFEHLVKVLREDGHRPVVDLGERGEDDVCQQLEQHRVTRWRSEDGLGKREGEREREGERAWLVVSIRYGSRTQGSCKVMKLRAVSGYCT